MNNNEVNNNDNKKTAGYFTTALTATIILITNKEAYDHEYCHMTYKALLVCSITFWCLFGLQLMLKLFVKLYENNKSLEIYIKLLAILILIGTLIMFIVPPIYVYSAYSNKDEFNNCEKDYKDLTNYIFALVIMYPFGWFILMIMIIMVVFCGAEIKISV